MLVQVIEKALENVEQQKKYELVAPGRSLSDDRRTSVTSAEGDSMRQQTATSDPFPAPKRLTWKIDQDIRQAIETATVDVDRLEGPILVLNTRQLNDGSATECYSQTRLRFGFSGLSVHVVRKESNQDFQRQSRCLHPADASVDLFQVSSLQLGF